MNTDGSLGQESDMEVEWDNASAMDDNHTWGAEPPFVWPSVRDRVWIDGRWIFDCGHVGSTRAVIYDQDGSNTFSLGDTLIAGDSQPLFQDFGSGPFPKGDALQPDPLLRFVDANANGTWDPGETLVYDANNNSMYDAGDGIAQGTAPAPGTPLSSDPKLTETVKSYPVNDSAYVHWSTEIHPPRGVVTFRLNHPVNSGSWLPVTGAQTRVPVTEADAYFSGNGGLANDVCSLINRHIDAALDSVDSCNHTGPVIPINNRNYVFDIYPPGTDFNAFDRPDPSKPWPVTPPSADASLQWRTIDQTPALPDHACGNTAPSNCVSVTPIFCPIDASTPPPTQTETSCPAAPARPTRLRVILPFAGSNANVFAQTILLGWDTVPAAPALPLRTFQIRLHNFTVVHNGESGIHDGDWRVFVDVGGQWRYLGNSFDRNPDGSNACHGDFLQEVGDTGNGDGDCFQFDQSPWQVTVQDGTPIHVAVGGWESDSIDSDFCRTFSGCDPSLGDGIDLACCNNDRIGTYEFDMSPPDYFAPDTFTTQRLDDGEQYSVTFTVTEIPNPPLPASDPLSIGSPRYTNTGGTTYVSSSTPLTLSTQSIDDVGFQYRSYRDGTPLPVYPSALPFPVHWTSTDFELGPRQASVFLNANDGADGPYTLQYSAQTLLGLTEPRNTAHVTLDNTPPTVTINQPAATTYAHSATLTLNYAVSDGAGSGVGSVTPTIDGAGTLAGHGLPSGQAIHLLTELSLGPHTFRVDATDHVANAATRSVTFTIIVTPQSIIDDVNQFAASGAIAQNQQTPLLATLNSAAQQYAAHTCAAAENTYQAFINQVQAQAGKAITAAAAAIMIADAQYLINHCP
jgi:hypothetical protein